MGDKGIERKREREEGARVAVHPAEHIRIRDGGSSVAEMAADVFWLNGSSVCVCRVRVCVSSLCVCCFCPSGVHGIAL